MAALQWAFPSPPSKDADGSALSELDKPDEEANCSKISCRMTSSSVSPVSRRRRPWHRFERDKEHQAASNTGGKAATRRSENYVYRRSTVAQSIDYQRYFVIGTRARRAIVRIISARPQRYCEPLTVGIVRPPDAVHCRPRQRVPYLPPGERSTFRRAGSNLSGRRDSARSDKLYRARSRLYRNFCAKICV